MNAIEDGVMVDGVVVDGVMEEWVVEYGVASPANRHGRVVPEKNPATFEQLHDCNTPS